MSIMKFPYKTAFVEVVAIMEDEYHYGGSPVLELICADPQRAGEVILEDAGWNDVIKYCSAARIKLVVNPRTVAAGEMLVALPEAGGVVRCGPDPEEVAASKPEPVKRPVPCDEGCLRLARTELDKSPSSEVDRLQAARNALYVVAFSIDNIIGTDAACRGILDARNMLGQILK